MGCVDDGGSFVEVDMAFALAFALRIVEVVVEEWHMVVGLVQRMVVELAPHMVVALARKQFAQPLLELVRSSQCILVLGMELESL